jgi:hypothetical protein
MEEGDCEVVIDSTLEDGHLSYGECYLPGMSVFPSQHEKHWFRDKTFLSPMRLQAWNARRLATMRKLSTAARCYCKASLL